jgi:glycosyltransferase involved in cell wall biosynthesis
VYVVVPDGIDDPTRPSGGNSYDRQLCRGLAAIGWSVRECAAAGSWPQPARAACVALAGVLAGLPDGAVVLLDGLIASSVPDVLVPESCRLRLVVLVHMPLGANGPGEDDSSTREHATLTAATAVVTTSAWTRDRLLDRYVLEPARIHVAEPGADLAELAPGTAAGGELLCVAAVTPEKGYDVLVEALAALTDLAWRCVCVGALDREPGFVDRLRRRALESGIGERVRFTGPRTEADLARAYAEADVLVLASRAETYGMVVTEALARGLPVIATAVGGLPDALGHDAGQNRPGLLVEPGDPAAVAAAIAGALRRWLGDTELRHSLRRSAVERRSTLSSWSTTADQVSRVLAEVAS